MFKSDFTSTKDKSTVPYIDEVEYLGEYNTVVSQAATEFGFQFSAIASPTLSKEETVTNLYQNILGSRLDRKIGSPPWRAYLEFVPRLILMFIRMVYVSNLCRVKEIPENCIYFHTWLVPKSVSGDIVRDDYFGDFPKDLADNQSVVISFHSLDIALVKEFKKKNTKSNYIIFIGLLGFVDIIKMMLDFIITAHLKLNGRYELNAKDITDEINKSLLLDYLHLRSFGAYQEKYICKKILTYKLKAFIYVFENQSLEKACCATLKSRGVKVVGYQSSGFSPLFLNLFPTVLDSLHHPMPDEIWTVGDYFTRFLVENGRYAIPVKTFSALRFPYDNNGLQYVISQPSSKILKKLLYAFSVHSIQYASIIKDLTDVFADSEISVDLKFHPLYDLKKEIQNFSLPRNFRIVKKVDMSKLKDSYDAVLFNDNSFGLEALFHGIKSYQYNKVGEFIDERFFYFDLWDTHLDFEGLIKIKQSILCNMFSKYYNVEDVGDYLNAMYRPYRKCIGYQLVCDILDINV
jgi:hypothetical protein